MTRCRFATLTAIATLFLLIAGGMVTSTDAGLAVPDWPRSYGTWFPPMVGGILYEHGHRMIAALVGLMILVQAAWLWKLEPRRWVRRLGYAALAAVILQGLLGGATVLLLLPPQISIAHACLGQAVFCLVVCLAVATRHSAEVPGTLLEKVPGTFVGGGTVLAVLAAAQLVLGALLRHTGQGLTLHVACAVALALVTAWWGQRLWRHRRALPAVWAHTVRLGLALAVQLGLGLSVWMHRGQVVLRTAHVAIGSLVLAQAERWDGGLSGADEAAPHDPCPCDHWSWLLVGDAGLRRSGPSGGGPYRNGAGRRRRQCAQRMDGT